MAYRFQTPTMQPYPTPPAGYGDGLHKIANTLMMARQMRAQKEQQQQRAEQEKMAAEEARRQFDAKQAASAEAAQRAAQQLALNEDANRRAEEQLSIQKAMKAKELYDAQQQKMAGNRADEAMAYAELAAGAKLPGPAGELYRRRAREMMMGMAGGDEPRQMAKGEETDEYRLAVEEVKLAIAPMLENGAQDERDAAAIVGEQVPGLLKQFSGDKEKAGKAALAQVKQLAAARAKERQSIRGAAAARGGKEYNSTEVKRGMGMGEAIMKRYGAYDAMRRFDTLQSAYDTIMSPEFRDNPQLQGSTNISILQETSGQRGHAFSNMDLKEALGESWFSQVERYFKQGFAGKAGAERREQMANTIQAAIEKQRRAIQRAYNGLQGQLEAYSGIMPEGSDALQSLSATAVDFVPYLEYLDQPEGEKIPRKRKKSSKVPVAKTIDDVEAFLE